MQGHSFARKGSGRDSHIQGSWGREDSSQVTARHPGPVGVTEDPEDSAQPCPVGSHTTADVAELGCWAEPWMHLAKSSWQSLHGWNRVFGAAGEAASPPRMQ